MSRTLQPPGRPEDVLRHVGPRTDVILPLANGEPVGLMDVLERHADALEGVRVHQMHALRERPYIHGAFGDRLRHVSYFLSAATRPAIWDGCCDLVPNHFSEMPHLLQQSLPRPLVLAAASPPDRHGYFSLGTNADYVAALPFFLEVNAWMPRTFGLNQVHSSEVAGWVELLPVDLVNDPRRIATEPRFISINATTEVDLYGQCASETIAGRYWSSSGGQADFARGALYAPGGKAFIVLHSTTSKGRSRIRVRLTEGSVVTTLKNTVDHVVTEWGIARLRGRSLEERAEALIPIAHPDHREALEREAVEAGLLRSGARRPGGASPGRRAHASAPAG